MALPKAKDSGSSKKKSAKKGQSRIASISSYFGDVRLEFRKVIWPSRDEVRSSTMVILTTLAFFSIFIGILDFIFSKAVNLVIP